MVHSRANEWNSGGGFSPLPVTFKKKGKKNHACLGRTRSRQRVLLGRMRSQKARALDITRPAWIPWAYLFIHLSVELYLRNLE